MVTTSRAYYAPVHKVKVLDRAKELESVSAAAREHGHEPSLVYTWKANESAIRKAARKEQVQEDKAASKALKNGAAKHGPPPPRDVALSNAITKKPVEDDSHSPEGPKFVVHALGPWLRDVVRQELPAAVDGQLEALIDRKLGNLDERLAEAVRQALKKGIG